MQLRTLAIIALAACQLGAVAQKKGKQAKKKATAAATIANLEPAIKPVPADSFSYAVGVAQAGGLKQYLVQRIGVDTAYMDDFYRGLTEPYNEVNAKRQKAYAAGLDIAEQNRTQVIGSLNKMATGKEDTTFVDPALYNKGLIEGLRGNTSLTEPDAMQLAERQMKYFQEKFKLINLAWLEANKKNKDVTTLPSGLQYKVITKGAGKVASDTSNVEVKYEGRLLDGTVFDSSYKRGQTATFKPTQVIKGWTEALQMMPEGSKWELYIPYDLAYGERGSQNIPPFSTLIFTVEVVSVK